MDSLLSYINKGMTIIGYTFLYERNMLKFMDVFGYNLVELGNLEHTNLIATQREIYIESLDDDIDYQRIIFDLSSTPHVSNFKEFFENVRSVNENIIFLIPMNHSMDSDNHMSFKGGLTSIKATDFAMIFHENGVRIIKNRYGEDNIQINYNELW